jgi:hypothetical protein
LSEDFASQLNQADKQLFSFSSELLSDNSSAITLNAFISCFSFASLFVLYNLVHNLTKKHFRVEKVTNICMVFTGKESIYDLTKQVEILTGRVLGNQPEIRAQE